VNIRWFILMAITAMPVMAAETLVVGVNEFRPCVVVDDGEVSGLDVDIVREICHSLDVKPRFVLVDDFGQMLDDVADGRFDMAVSGVSITGDRAHRFCFSQPYLDSGLRIVTMAQSPFIKSVRQCRTLVTRIFLGIWPLLLTALLFAHIVWLIERSDGCFDARYHIGIREAIYWTIVTMSTVGYGDYAPKRPSGRLCGAFVILIGVGIFGVILANITDIVTNPGDFGSLSGPEELSGKRVATIKDTTSVTTCTALGASIVRVKDADEAERLLRGEAVDAVVFDSPAILAMVNDSKGELELAGDMFDDQRYGVVMPRGSEIQDDVDQALLELMESDRYDDIRARWLGKGGCE
jgi:polar amino acid transport system substrate-binding protein